MTKVIEDYYPHAVPQYIKKGNYIYDPLMSKSDCAYMLDSGICALTSFTPNGNHKIHMYVTAKHIVGFAHLIEQNVTLPQAFKATHEIAIVAKTDCVVYKMESAVFSRLLQTDLDFNRLMFKIISENYLTIFHRYMQMEETSIPARICMFLSDYCEQDGGHTILPGYFTYNEISDYLNIHPVTAARIMGILKERGYIDKHGKKTCILNPEALQKIANKTEILKY